MNVYKLWLLQMPISNCKVSKQKVAAWMIFFNFFWNNISLDQISNREKRSPTKPPKKNQNKGPKKNQKNDPKKNQKKGPEKNQNKGGPEKNQDPALRHGSFAQGLLHQSQFSDC